MTTKSLENAITAEFLDANLLDALLDQIREFDGANGNGDGDTQTPVPQRYADVRSTIRGVSVVLEQEPGYNSCTRFYLPEMYVRAQNGCELAFDGLRKLRVYITDFLAQKKGFSVR